MVGLHMLMGWKSCDNCFLSTLKFNMTKIGGNTVQSKHLSHHCSNILVDHQTRFIGDPGCGDPANPLPTKLLGVLVVHGMWYL